MSWSAPEVPTMVAVRPSAGLRGGGAGRGDGAEPQARPAEQDDAEAGDGPAGPDRVVDHDDLLCEECLWGAREISSPVAGETAVSRR